MCHIGCDNTLGEKKDNFAKFISITTHKGRGQKKKSERPVDALAVKTVNHPLTDNLESRDASASKNPETIWRIIVTNKGHPVDQSLVAEQGCKNNYRSSPLPPLLDDENEGRKNKG